MKKYYYHLTDKEDWGDSIILTPRKDGPNRSDDELDWARVCVSDEIEKCLTAIPNPTGRKLFIYRTKNKIEASTPPKNHGIFDIKVTEEKWVRRKTCFVKIGEVFSLKEYKCPAAERDMKYSKQFYKNLKNKKIKMSIEFFNK